MLWSSQVILLSLTLLNTAFDLMYSLFSDVKWLESTGVPDCNNLVI